MLRLLTLFFCTAALTAAGQNPDIKRTMHWYFGKGAGLDFTSGVPLVDTTSVVRSGWAIETSFTLSDTCSNLLLYGYDSIYSKNHQFIYDLQLNNNLTQMLAIPQPGNDSMVYIFYENSLEQRLYYSIVNLNLNAGEGAVIFTDSLLGNFNSRITQKLAAYHHCNDQDIWISTKLALPPYNKNLYSFLLSSTGINTTPVISPVVIKDQMQENDAGCIRFSPDGTMMVACYEYGDSQFIGDMDSNYVELYQFDNCTGQFSNALSWNWQTPYSAAFSPNSNVLYVSTEAYADTAFAGPWGADSSYIIQYDVSNYNLNAILSSQQLFYLKDTLIGQMQLGPDGKIYIGDMNRWQIFNTTIDSSVRNPGIIHNPNVMGIGCNYEANAIYLYRPHLYGFPNFVDSYFRDLNYYDCETGVDEKMPNTEGNIQLWCNPAGDFLRIHNNGTEQAHFNIYDLSGKFFFSDILQGGSGKNFDVHSLSPGMYIINAQSNNQISILKFIKL